MATDGIDTQLLWNSVAVGEMEELGDIEVSRSANDSTTYGTTDGYKRARGGLREFGEIDFTLVYNKDDTAQQALVANFNSEASESFSIRFSDGSEMSGQGFVVKLGTSIPMDDVIKRQVSIKPSGPLTEGTWTPQS